jgi:hypothetical protein
VCGGGGGGVRRGVGWWEGFSEKCPGGFCENNTRPNFPFFA